MVFLLWFFNMTALIYAAQYGYYDIFEILLKHPKINCTISDEKGRNALYHASHEGMTKIVDLILKSKKFDVNKVDSNKSTALHQACSKGYENIVKLLLKEENINLNLQDDDGIFLIRYLLDSIKLCCIRRIYRYR